jgi:hypothetical protein
MIASKPWLRSFCQALKTPSMVVVGSDVDTSPVEVEAERLGSAVAEGKGGCGLGRVAEPVQLTQPDRTGAGLDVTKDAAGADRGKLLIITDQPDTATAGDDELHSGVQG